MRGLICGITLAALLAVAGSAAAADSAMQYVGANGTYDQADNWQELVYDPSGYYLLDPNSTRVPTNWEAPGGKNVLDPNSWRDESAYISSGATVTINSSLPTIAKLIVGPHADTVRDFSEGAPSDPSYGVMDPSGLPSRLVIEDGAILDLNRVDETSPGDASVDVVFRQQSAYGAEIIQTGGSISTVNTYICEDAATNVGNGLRPYQGTVHYMMTGGTLDSRYKMYIGMSLAASTGDSEAWGYFDMSDGTLNIGNTTHGGQFGVGVDGRGTMGIAGGLINTASGYSSVGLTVGSGTDPNTAALGSVNQTGGTVHASKFLLIGRDNGVGEYTISDGLLEIGGGGGPVVDSDIGAGGSHGAASGTLTIEGGRVELTGPGALRIGNSNGSASGAGGTLRMTGGEFVSTSTEYNSLKIGYDTVADPNVGHGLVEVTGGSFEVAGRVCLGVDGGNGTLHVGKDATFKVDSLTTNYASTAGGTATISLELGGLSDYSRIQITGGTADLRGSSHRAMNVLTPTGYRPVEGAQFAVITGGTAAIEGTLNAITSDIALGRQYSVPGDPNSTPIPFFAGAAAADPNASVYSYVLTFQGLTYGDTNADHAVDGGDLAIMGGNWMQGSSEPFYGDCTLDNSVDGGDLAIIGGNWMDTGGTMTWADGDFNGDGNIDGGDLALMGGNWMQTRTPMSWATGDFNGDGVVDGGDLALMGGMWMWSLSAPAPSQPVPEPLTLAILTLGGLAVVRVRRR